MPVSTTPSSPRRLVCLPLRLSMAFCVALALAASFLSCSLWYSLCFLGSLTPFITLRRISSFLSAIIMSFHRECLGYHRSQGPSGRGRVSDLKGFFFFGPIVGGEPPNTRRVGSLPRLA